MNILLIGTVKLSRSCLSTMIKNNYLPAGVVTKSASSFNADYAPMNDICEEYSIPYIYADDVNAEVIYNWILNIKPDVILCIGWSQLLSAKILSIPPLGTIGYHPACLPNNRGRHPVIWALVLGLKQTGSTFFMMDEGADSGDIISQTLIDIYESDNAESLYEKIDYTARNQLIRILQDLQQNRLRRQKQDETISNYWRKRSKKDGEIDWRMSSTAIHNLVRALYRPYPGASVLVNGREYKIWKTEICREVIDVNIEPGKIISCDRNRVLVKTYDGALYLVEHSIETSLEKGSYL